MISLRDIQGFFSLFILILILIFIPAQKGAAMYASSAGALSSASASASAAASHFLGALENVRWFSECAIDLTGRAVRAAVEKTADFVGVSTVGPANGGVGNPVLAFPDPSVEGPTWVVIEKVIRRTVHLLGFVFQIEDLYGDETSEKSQRGQHIQMIEDAVSCSKETLAHVEAFLQVAESRRNLTGVWPLLYNNEADEDDFSRMYRQLIEKDRETEQHRQRLCAIELVLLGVEGFIPGVMDENKYDYDSDYDYKDAQHYQDSEEKSDVFQDEDVRRAFFLRVINKLNGSVVTRAVDEWRRGSANRVKRKIVNCLQGACERFNPKVFYPPSNLPTPMSLDQDVFFETRLPSPRVVGEESDAFP